MAPETQQSASQHDLQAAQPDLPDMTDEAELLPDDAVAGPETPERSRDTLPDRAETPEEQREREKRERQPLLDALRTRGLQPQAALEIIAAYDRSILDDQEFSSELGALADSYGVDLSGLEAGDRDKLAVMYLGIKNGRADKSKEQIAEVLETGLRDQLVGQAFRNIDTLQKGMELEKADPEQLKGQVLDIMKTLNALSKQLPRENEDNEDTWRNIYERFHDLVGAKRAGGAMNPEVDKAFSSVFEQFSGFIEDEMVDMKMRSGMSVEDATRDSYGRSKEEMEQIKVRNRAEVATAIKSMAEAPLITQQMLEELHEINNRGIVPKKHSKMRSNADQLVVFNKRMGLMGDDVQPEIQKMLERANDLYDSSLVGQTSNIQYEISAARLHNDLLDMHPFNDRNGSTSLLFLELMMARKGYEPPKERQKDFYRNLAQIVGYNPVAIGVVGYEQYKIENEVGYYGRETMTGDQKIKYEAILAAFSGLRQRSGKTAPAKEKFAGKLFKAIFGTSGSKQ